MLNNHEALIKVAWANNGDILKSHGSQVSSVKRYFCVVEKFIDIISCYSLWLWLYSTLTLHTMWQWHSTVSILRAYFVTFSSNKQQCFLHTMWKRLFCQKPDSIRRYLLITRFPNYKNIFRINWTTCILTINEMDCFFMLYRPTICTTV